jgi:hypothetical protein
MISYITIASSFFCLLSEDIEVIDTYELKFMKMIRVLSIARLESIFKRRNMPLARAIFGLVFEAISIVLLFACAMLRIENRWYRLPYIKENLDGDPSKLAPATLVGWTTDYNYFQLRFHDVIYYSVVTITSTGYGDISP